MEEGGLSSRTYAFCSFSLREVVWDVDLLSEEVVRVYRASEPNRPTVYRRGEVAEAEPALPGRSMLVDELFA